ncbi:MAG: amidophosphoribosyltransferase [Prevotellaceae bacterium]|nr:amidophosphoribosyltransferase [Prevotellaceae bacterium]
MCGIALIRLRKPLEYYQGQYGTWKYGLNKLYLLMEKQHNRGQEGAGLGMVKFDMPLGKEYIWRERAEGKNAIQNIFASVNKHYENLSVETLNDANYAKQNLPFAGELYFGHLRYSTTENKKGVSYVHPFLRRHNWKDRTALLAGNFNLTNVDELFDQLTASGQHPRDKADTFLMLEIIGHELDKEVEREYENYKQTTGKTNAEITQLIEENLDIAKILRKSEKTWDGGYAIMGLLGHGDAFVFRDAKGIRPAFYYEDEEVVVVASERPVIQTVMNVEVEDVHELAPGKAMIIKKNGDLRFETIRQEEEKAACSFERIYFSRGSDIDIYKERKKLGELLTTPILKSVDYDVENTVFSYIPNTAEVAFYGMMQGIEQATQKRPRREKVLIKDIKLRTFIAQDNDRNDLATHVYDISYGSIIPEKDNLVIIDDSIVRGTTLKQSIIGILNRLSPKKIVIVSSSPQVRYPDYYGIDMSRLSEFASFRAAIDLLKERGMDNVINEVYKKSKAQEHLPKEEIVNYVREIYAPFTMEEISRKTAQMLTPASVKCPVEIVYQTLEGLREACPDHKGDWYFSGYYPTAGGNRLINNAFIAYIEGRDKKSGIF